MNPMILGSIFEIGKSLIDRFIPNPEEKQKAEMEMMRMAADGELKQVIAQLEINAREAGHSSIFVAGWRPFFGWVGGAGFMYSVLIQPVLSWYGASRGWPAAPMMDIDLLWVVITGMLGIGGLRTFEKKVGVTK